MIGGEGRIKRGIGRWKMTGRIEMLKYERARRRRSDLMEKEEISFRIKVMKCRGVEVTSGGI